MIERAKVVLAKLEAEDRAAPRGFEDLPLFAAAPRPAAAPPPGRRARRPSSRRWPRSIPDEMSPREALEALYALKAKAAQGRIARCATLR